MLKTAVTQLLVAVMVLLTGGCTSFHLTPKTPRQSAFIENTLAKISAETTEDQLVALLGPLRERNARHLFFDGPLHIAPEAVRINYRGGKIARVEYIHLGHFMWSRDPGKEASQRQESLTR